jgi:inner membrane protein
MDPLAHTLVGAALAETGLRRATPLATATLILGANAPDIDVVSQLGGTDAMLYWRRGLTHGVLAMAVMPVALTAVMLLWDRTVRRRWRPGAPAADPRRLLGLAALAVLTHPLLDWMNTYGVRLLMPFDGRWFYGDAFFIIDPWVWLLAGAAVVLARTRGKVSVAAFVVLGCATTAVVVLPPVAPTATKVGWLLGLFAIVALRLAGEAPGRTRALATACLGALALYMAAAVTASEVARADAVRWMEAQGLPVDEAAAGPIPAKALAREVIVRSGDTYYFVERDWTADPGLRFGHHPIPRGPRGPIVQAALDAPQVQGMRQWMRFPHTRVTSDDEGHTVTIEDVRYSRARVTTIGTAVVRLDPDLRPQ